MAATVRKSFASAALGCRDFGAPHIASLAGGPGGKRHAPAGLRPLWRCDAAGWATPISSLCRGLASLARPSRHALTAHGVRKGPRPSSGRISGSDSTQAHDVGRARSKMGSPLLPIAIVHVPAALPQSMSSRESPTMAASFGDAPTRSRMCSRGAGCGLHGSNERLSATSKSCSMRTRTARIAASQFRVTTPVLTPCARRALSVSAAPGRISTLASASRSSSSTTAMRRARDGSSSCDAMNSRMPASHARVTQPANLKRRGGRSPEQQQGQAPSAHPPPGDIRCASG
mmetsp:Transcript_2226/g.8571  ORF Transcript_2226/g.8571 Transcript_2226/m.8571 type:complete len:287 (-) Transcript_2226:293-1153(-)